MKKKNPKVIIVMPAYNAEKTVRDTYYSIPKDYRKYVILVDDESKDNTIKVAKKLGIKVLAHYHNLGYGANQKTCYREALRDGADIVVMLHPDNQYPAAYIPQLVKPIADGEFDLMFGNRMNKEFNPRQEGMSGLKYYTNRFFCIVQNYLLKVNLSEYFSGLRAFSADLLKTVPFDRFSDDHLVDQHMIFSALSYKFRIGEVNIPTNYDEKASSMDLKRGIKFVRESFIFLAIYLLHHYNFRKSRLFAPEF